MPRYKATPADPAYGYRSWPQTCPCLSLSVDAIVWTLVLLTARDLGADGITVLTKLATALGLRVRRRAVDVRGVELMSNVIVDIATRNAQLLEENFGALHLRQAPNVEGRTFFASSAAIMGEFELELQYSFPPGDYQFMVKHALARHTRADVQAGGSGPGAADSVPCSVFATGKTEFFAAFEKIPLVVDRHSGRALHSIQAWKIPGQVRPTFDRSAYIYQAVDKELVKTGVYGWNADDQTWHWDRMAFARGVCPIWIENVNDAVSGQLCSYTYYRLANLASNRCTSRLAVCSTLSSSSCRWTPPSLRPARTSSTPTSSTALLCRMWCSILCPTHVHHGLSALRC